MSQMLHLDKLGGSIVRNDSGEIIPPNAVVRIYDAAVVDGEPVLLGDKPDGSGGRHVINGPSQIAIDGFGECYEGYGKYALYDTGGDAPVNGDTFGPAADEWHLVKGNAGFTIVGGIQSGSVRVAVESGGVLADMMSGVVAAYDATEKVITPSYSPNPPLELPSGTPTIPPGVKVWDRDNIGYSATDKFLAIRSVGIHTSGTHGQLDWFAIPTTAGSNPMRIVTVDATSMSQSGGFWVEHHRDRHFSGSIGVTAGVEDIWILLNDHHDDMQDDTTSKDKPMLPVLSQWLGFDTGETFDPQTAQDDEFGNPPAWNSSEEDYGTGAGEIDTVTHDDFIWHAVGPNINANEEPNDESIYWTKGEAVEASDDRPVYRIDGLPPSPIPGYVAESVSAASGQGGATPIMSGGDFQTYVQNDLGEWVHGPLLAGVLYNLEKNLEPGTTALTFYGLGGFWMMPGCGVGSAYVAPE